MLHTDKCNYDFECWEDRQKGVAMTRRTCITIALALILTTLPIIILTACSAITGEPTQDFSSASYYSDFVGADARIGSKTGDVYAQVAREVFFAAETPEYATVGYALDALLAGELDAVLASGGFARQLVSGDRGEYFSYITVPPELFMNEAGPIFHTDELRDAYNDWFARAKNESLWDQMVNRWLHGALPVGDDVPQFQFSAENGILRVADTGSYAPLSFVDADGEMIGFGVEVVSRFAQDQGLGLEIIQLNYDEIVSAVTEGTVDMSACVYSIFAQNTEDLIFGEPGISMQAILIIPRAPSE